MTRFSDSQAGQTEFKGKYEVAGWIKARDLLYKTFDIHGVDFRKSSFGEVNGETHDEYVMFIMLKNEEDAQELGLEDPYALYGVSGQHWRLLQVLKNADEDEFPLEDVTIVEQNTGKGNAALAFADPTSVGEAEEAKASQRGIPGKTGAPSARTPNSGGAKGGTVRTNTAGRQNAR